MALIMGAIGPQVVGPGHHGLKMTMIVGAIGLQVGSDRENSRFYMVPRSILGPLGPSRAEASYRNIYIDVYVQLYMLR